MLVRDYRSGDFETINSWWLEHLKLSFPKDYVSKYGVVAYDPAPQAVIFMYPTLGSSMALLGFPVVNPKANRKERDEALDAAYTEIRRRAKGLGYSSLWTWSGVPPVMGRLSKLGYTGTDEEVTIFKQDLREA